MGLIGNFFAKLRIIGHVLGLPFSDPYLVFVYPHSSDPSFFCSDKGVPSPDDLFVVIDSFYVSRGFPSFFRDMVREKESSKFFPGVS